MSGAAFKLLVERQASKEEFLEWFSEAQISSAPEWLDNVIPVSEACGGFSWMDWKDSGWVHHYVRSFIQDAFTKEWISSVQFAPDFEQSFTPFIQWLSKRSDLDVVSFCWELLAHDRRIPPPPVWWLRDSGRIHGAISYANLSLAVSLAAESDAMFWWPKQRWAVASWERDSWAYLQLLSHESYLVRAAAAQVLGRIFFKLTTKNPRGGAPPLADILGVVQELEVKTPGIAGPFLAGANWYPGLDEWSSFDAGVDMKAWFLATLAQSEVEPSVPHHQPLEFHAHEFFAYDADAIREFLKMGRRHLAVMTATEEPAAIPGLLPVLNEMVASSDPEVSAAIREYLKYKSHHAGTQHLTKLS